MKYSVFVLICLPLLVVALFVAFLLMGINGNDPFLTVVSILGMIGCLFLFFGLKTVFALLK